MLLKILAMSANPYRGIRWPNFARAAVFAWTSLLPERFSAYRCNSCRPRVLKIINVYSLPIHNGSFATDNERRLADLNSVGRFVEELCSAKSLSDQAKDFIRCCEAQTSAGQLLTHPFCLVDKFLNWEKAGSGSVNMFTQRTGRFAGPSARRGRGGAQHGGVPLQGVVKLLILQYLRGCRGAPTNFES